MSDSLCGPSNAGKSLVAHAERDRSLHQDRFVSRPDVAGLANVGTSFHSQSQQANAAAAQASYQNYVNSQVALGPLGQPAAAMNLLPHAPSPRAENLPPHSGFVQGRPQAAMPTSGVSFNHQTTNAADASWIREFAGAQVGAASPAGVTSVSLAQPLAAMPATSMAPGMAFGPAFSQYSAAQAPFMNPFMSGGLGPAPFTQQSNFPAAAQQASAIPNGLHKSEDEQFDFAFSDFANARFEDDVADATTAKEGTTATGPREAVTETHDFQAEMDKWMAEHHPRNETKDYYMDDMNDTMRSLALEQEVKQGLAEETTTHDKAKPPADQELKRAAASILDSVADNTSEKFQQSTFLALMKRIAEEEVVLQGENLIDTATGVNYKVSVDPVPSTHEE